MFTFRKVMSKICTDYLSCFCKPCVSLKLFPSKVKNFKKIKSNVWLQ